MTLYLALAVYAVFCFGYARGIQKLSGEEIDLLELISMTVLLLVIAPFSVPLTLGIALGRCK